MIYYILFFLFLLESLFILIAHGRYQVEKVEKVLYVFGAFILFALAAFRVNIGNDYGAYQEIFVEMHDTNISLHDRIFNDAREMGYNLFNLLFPNYRCLIVFITFFQVWLSCTFFYKQNGNRLLCLFMFYASLFLYYDMGIMRQGLAIAISYSGLRYVKERKFKYYLSILFLASIIHITAIFMLPLYWIGEKEFSRKTYYGILLLSIFSTGAMYQVIVWIGHMNIPYISHKIQYYTSEYFVQNKYYLSIAKRIVVGILFIEFFKRTIYRILGDFSERFKVEKHTMISQHDEVWLYINGYILSIIVFIFFYFIPFLGTRGSAGLYFLQIPIFARMADEKKNRWFNFIVFFIISILFFYTMNNTVVKSQGHYIPYKSVFQ